jgi:hypothetical protein
MEVYGGGSFSTVTSVHKHTGIRAAQRPSEHHMRFSLCWQVMHVLPQVVDIEEQEHGVAKSAEMVFPMRMVL